MKKFNVIVILSALLIGCTDLEENPEGILAPELLSSTVADVQAAVNGAYANLAHENYWGRKISLSILLRSDMCDIGNPSTAGRRQDVNNFNMLANNGMTEAFWPRSYIVIGAANQAIGIANGLDVDEAEINPIIAEAYFVRAFAYYHLVRLFGDVPYLEDAVSDATTLDVLERTPEDEVYANIISDLQFCKEWLPMEQPDRGKPFSATAMAYLASVYLTIGEYQNAYNEAKAIIDNESGFNLGLETDFQNLFLGDSEIIESLREPLFTLDFISQENSGLFGDDLLPPLTGISGDQTEGRGAGGGWSVAVPNINVYDRWNGRDYRKRVSFDTVATIAGQNVRFTEFKAADPGNGAVVDRPHIAKYTRQINAAGSGRFSDNDYVMMRYAEVLFIAAEALNEITPGAQEATDYINRIRERARNFGGTVSDYPPDLPANLSKDQMRDSIIEERRLELAFEMKRWYDIKRLQLGPEVFGPQGLEPHANFDAGRDYLMPLTTTQLNINPELGQNPGY